jgi:hypothetical protein
MDDLPLTRLDAATNAVSRESTRSSLTTCEATRLARQQLLKSHPTKRGRLALFTSSVVHSARSPPAEVSKIASFGEKVESAQLSHRSWRS